ncbi:MAG: cation:proton antiporter [Myxococcota bacterium]
MKTRIVLGYAAMLAVTVALYLVIRWYGEGLGAPITDLVQPSIGHGGGAGTFAPVLLALAVITVATQGVGWLFRRFLRQPPVMGEIVAGIVLGPSVLGALWPAAGAFVLPDAAAPYLGIVAKIGVVLFMFLVGLELDLSQIRRQGHATIAISHASIVTPFLLGSAAALVLYRSYAPPGIGFTAFSLFVGVSMSVTAFPVLARILTDRGVQRTPLGALALSCAAVDDVTAWTLLAFVAGVATAHGSGFLWVVGWVAAYLLAMLAVVRPLVSRLAAAQNRLDGPLSKPVLAVICVAMLLSALATEAIGIHALFGAFLLGAMLPHDGRLAELVRARIEDLVLVLFLPAFFAFTGMRTRIGLVDTPHDWLICALIIGVATAGKFGGSYVAARLVGMKHRDASAIGVLMNTRGLMELIVLNVGLDMGILSPTLFAMMVIMALVTTFSTTPALDAVLGRRGFDPEPFVGGPHPGPFVGEGPGPSRAAG